MVLCLLWRFRENPVVKHNIITTTILTCTFWLVAMQQVVQDLNWCACDARLNATQLGYCSRFVGNDPDQLTLSSPTPILHVLARNVYYRKTSVARQWSTNTQYHIIVCTYIHCVDAIIYCTRYMPYTCMCVPRTQLHPLLLFNRCSFTCIICIHHPHKAYLCASNIAELSCCLRDLSQGVLVLPGQSYAQPTPLKMQKNYMYLSNGIFLQGLQ